MLQTINNIGRVPFRTVSTFKLVRTTDQRIRQIKRKTIKDFITGLSFRGLINPTMDGAMDPPPAVRGMVKLDRAAFARTLQVPAIKIPVTSIHTLGKAKMLKDLQLRMIRIKPLAEIEDGDVDAKTHKVLLLNPEKVQSCEDLSDDAKDSLTKCGADLGSWRLLDIDVGYENWNHQDILKAVLPQNYKGVSGAFSTIGHILHLNLGEEVLPYKSLIGEVLLDKVSTAKTVVNKTHIVHNVYRNFQMEVIAGEEDFITTVKEHGVRFKMDFSKVYWNPRLSTEHTRLVSLLNAGDILYDVMAGIGPFAIPAAKKKCTVHANDLNPESYKWLNENITLNKLKVKPTTYNLDGRDFIRQVMKPDLLCVWQDDARLSRRIHVTMNLPALAVEFLDAFPGLFSQQELDATKNFVAPRVHCYTFTKCEDRVADVTCHAESVIGCALPDCEVRHVRDVAPNKDMMCVSFNLTKDILSSAANGTDVEPESKKLKISENTDV